MNKAQDNKKRKGECMDTGDMETTEGTLEDLITQQIEDGSIVSVIPVEQGILLFVPYASVHRLQQEATEDHLRSKQS